MTGRPLRIALVSQEYPPETARGGIGTQTHAKAHGLAALGHEVHVVSHSQDEDLHEYRDGPVRVTRIPGPDARQTIYTEGARCLAYSVEAAAAVARLHAEQPLDVVDFPEYGGEGYVHLLNRADGYRVPTVIHLHGPMVMLAHAVGWPEPDSELYRLGTAMESACLRLADAVLSSSRCSAEWCARQYGLDAARVPVLHTGVDTRLFRPEPAKADRPTVVFAGKIVPNKGAEDLVEAALRLATEYPGLRVRLLGRDELKLAARLQARAATRGFPDLLDLPGFVRREDLPAQFAAAHVFALPSVYEGGPGFVYLEAMACGVPVIACSGSGAAEVVRPGETGLLVPPHDVAALTAALRRLLAEPGESAAMGRAGRRFVEAEADSAVCLRRLESLYAGVVEKCR